MKQEEVLKSSLLLRLAKKLVEDANHLTKNSGLGKQDVASVLRLALEAENATSPVLGFGESAD